MTPISLQTGKLDEVIANHSQMLAICPVSNTRLTTNQWQQATIFGDEALWWKCSICEDWHLVLIDRK